MPFPILPCLYWYFQRVTESLAFFNQLMKLTESSFLAFSTTESEPVSFSLIQPHASCCRVLVPLLCCDSALPGIIDRIYHLETLCWDSNLFLSSTFEFGLGFLGIIYLSSNSLTDKVPEFPWASSLLAQFVMTIPLDLALAVFSCYFLERHHPGLWF